MHPDIERAVAILRRGGLVAFPTETVYGLGANALDSAAVERIFAAKGRPATSPLIVHVAGFDMLPAVVDDWPEAAQQLADRFWPGPLTLVLRKSNRVPDRVTAGLGTVGVRMPSHPLALELIRAAGIPVAAPSANRFTGVSPTCAEHVRRALGDAVDLVLDGGPTQVGIESTVLALPSGGRPMLLRPGMITREQIEAVIGAVTLGAPPDSGGHASPGQHERHYSPSTPVRLGTDPGARSAYVWWDSPSTTAAATVQLPRHPQGYAQALYAALHSLDLEKWDAIVVEPVPGTSEWDGVRDRLERAAARPPEKRRPEIA